MRPSRTNLHDDLAGTHSEGCQKHIRAIDEVREDQILHLLNPKYKGEFLTDDQKAREWLQELNPAFVPYAINFELKDKLFPSTFFSEDAIESVPTNGGGVWKILAKC